jgi:predicted nucleic acid-binding protein
MSTYLLDTNIIIDILNDKKGRRALVLDLLNQGHVLACCPINVSEIYAGLRPKEEATTEEFLRSLQYFDITWPIARQAGLLKREYSQKGKTLTISDATIAAVALHHKVTLITANVRDFPMKDLTIYSL